jgi:hypothetical protein
MHFVQVLVAVMGAMVCSDLCADGAPAPATQPTTRAAGGVETRQSQLAWNTRTVADAYEKVGKHNPKWDDKARQATAAMCQAFVGNQEEKYNFAVKALESARAAISAGCGAAAGMAGCEDRVRGIPRGASPRCVSAHEIFALVCLSRAVGASQGRNGHPRRQTELGRVFTAGVRAAAKVGQSTQEPGRGKADDIDGAQRRRIVAGGVGA